MQEVMAVFIWLNKMIYKEYLKLYKQMTVYIINNKFIKRLRY